MAIFLSTNLPYPKLCTTIIGKCDDPSDAGSRFASDYVVLLAVKIPQSPDMNERNMKLPVLRMAVQRTFFLSVRVLKTNLMFLFVDEDEYFIF